MLWITKIGHNYVPISIGNNVNPIGVLTSDLRRGIQVVVNLSSGKMCAVANLIVSQFRRAFKNVLS